MKKRLTTFLALALTSTLLAAPISLHSELFIEAGKLFVLGGGQAGAFTVAGKNVGTVPVEVQERPLSGPTATRGTLAPGQRARLTFAPGSAALLLNPSAENAHLSLDVTGSTRALGMTYEATKK